MTESEMTWKNIEDEMPPLRAQVIVARSSTRFLAELRNISSGVRQHFACPDLTPAALGKIAIDASTNDRREQVRLHAAKQLSRMLVRALDRDNGKSLIVQDIMRMLSQYI